jgi:hypothetical protein
MHNTDMDFREWRAQLRGAVFRGDGEHVAALVASDGQPTNSLQLLGEGLLASVAQGVDAAPELAKLAARALRERDWYGDAELADQIEGLLGTRAMPSLRPLTIDLDVLGDILEGDPFQGMGRIDLETGEAWPQFEIQYAETVGEEEPDRWLWVTPEGPGAVLRDARLFTDAVADEGLQASLRSALEGDEPLREFERVLEDFPSELDQWHALSEDHKRGRTRSWLAAAGFSQAIPAEPRM